MGIKLHAIRQPDGNYRTPFDEDGDWIVRVGEAMAIDATPRNARGQACDYDDLPEWNVDDGRGILRELRSPNPFLYWTEAREAGIVEFVATIDGVRSVGLRVAIR